MFKKKTKNCTYQSNLFKLHPTAIVYTLLYLLFIEQDILSHVAITHVCFNYDLSFETFYSLDNMEK